MGYNRLKNMKKIFVFACLLLISVNGVNGFSALNCSCGEMVQNAPVEVWYYTYNFKTGESVCVGNGYVRHENNKLIIHVEGRAGGDFIVYSSDVRGFRYMFRKNDILTGELTTYYFNM